MADANTLGLALSGGGSRAAAFHCGTVAALDELHLLEKVDVVSTVSGGIGLRGGLDGGAVGGQDHRRVHRLDADRAAPRIRPAVPAELEAAAAARPGLPQDGSDRGHLR